MNWCCQKFKFRFELAGLRGLSLCVKKSGNLESEFFMQFRIVDGGEFITFNEDVRVVFAEESSIQFCPWCGKKLSAVYRNIPQGFIRNDLDVSAEGLNQLQISKQNNL